ncbi:MAG: response regulator transcription factor [Bacteroidetes bacterium]|nr:MAG: response regulator transcription factor [Bacteroidota bacterium]
MDVLIIDDERLARTELKSLLEKFDFLNIVDEASNPKEGIEKIKKYQPDLIFLDIQMPGMTGFEMLQRLEEIPKVIFVTAFDEFAVKAFEVDALDYLLKPIDPDRLNETVAKLREHEDEFSTKLSGIDARKDKILSPGDKIFIKDGEKCWYVDIGQVRMFESDGNYVKVYFDRFRPLILRSLNSLEERLDSNYFFRANRKYIINLNWISSIENWFNGGLRVTLRDENELIEISRRQAIRFKEQMSL